MGLTRHRLLGPEHFLRLEASFQRMIDHGVAALASGNGDPQRLYDSLCHNCEVMATIELVLGRPDDEVLRQFNDATRYALEWLRAPGSTARIRVYDVEVNLLGRIRNTFALRERKPNREPRLLSITDYARILALVVAFGSANDIRQVAQCPEEKYQSRECFVEPYFFEYMRAWREWLSGSENAATVRIARLNKDTSKQQPTATLRCLAAITANDDGAFRQHLDALLAAYQAQVEDSPNDPKGAVSVVGLSLCRLARNRGIAVADGPYLPVRLLPNVCSPAS